MLLNLPPKSRHLLARLRTGCIDSNLLIAISVAFMVLSGNFAFWFSLFAVIDLQQPSMWLVALASFTVIFAVTFVFIAVFGPGRALKPVIGLLLVISSLSAYYMDEYGVFFDDVMLLSMLETTWHEASELLDFGIIRHFLLTGALPLYLLYKARLCARPWRQAVLRRVLVAGGVFAAASLVLFLSYKDFAFVFREHREIGFLVNPVYPIRSAVRVVRAEIHKHQYPFVPAFRDARRLAGHDGLSRNGRHNVLVIVVGETARAQNFSLNGYARDTTPKLRALAQRGELVNFSDVTACGTATAISLPCMFSDLGHENYDGEAARNRDNLLDALANAGLRVLWRENNPDCKGICKRIDTHSPQSLHVDGLCQDGLCFDEVLLHGLDEYLAGIETDAVIVLHSQGSHGPAYYRRYPEDFRRFLPECRTSTVQDCSQEEVVNAYDNTIAYTDELLSRLIAYLASRTQRFNTAMLYVSDHGESLGEYGVYLHGLPYFLAPPEQTRVPMVFWSSDGFEQAVGLDRQCLLQHAAAPLSHDNFLHSVLGLMDVRVAQYDAALDVFAPCRLSGDGRPSSP